MAMDRSTHTASASATSQAKGPCDADTIGAIIGLSVSCGVLFVVMLVFTYAYSRCRVKYRALELQLHPRGDIQLEAQRAADGHAHPPTQESEAPEAPEPRPEDS
ncbi:hypothetical protein PCL_03836 [Purpureocillium lilacinum]|uniref:Uncharacterized protein n=1 Tax=Purpureocillium lilacinum TaxID=33203 RepID=A0A2U3EQ62_PURLI|nr:hypothetical protein PCL_03836 [Purpureocillium lilacinum]